LSKLLLFDFDVTVDIRRAWLYEYLNVVIKAQRLPTNVPVNIK